VYPLGTGILREIHNALLDMVAASSVEEDVGTAARITVPHCEAD
jgi:hypothetical protein